MVHRPCAHCGDFFTRSNPARFCFPCMYHIHVYQQISNRAMRRAINAGVIPKINEQTRCVDCGKSAEHYDHRDYLKPLEVEPVCRSCNFRRGTAHVPKRVAA